MNFKKYSCIVSVLLAFGMVACSDNESDSGADTAVGSAAFDYSYTRTYTMISQDEDRYVRTYEHKSCDKAQAIVEIDTTEVYYGFSDGQLALMGEDMDCVLIFSGGKSNTLGGTWTMVSSEKVNPNGYYSDCEVEAGSTHTISFDGSSIVRSTQVNDYCYAETEVAYFADKLSADVQLTMSGCNTIKATDAAGNVATSTLLVLDKQMFHRKMALTYNGQSCTYEYQLKEATDELCADAYAAFQKENADYSFHWSEWVSDASQKEYDACVEKLGVSEALKTIF